MTIQKLSKNRSAQIVSRERKCVMMTKFTNFIKNSGHFRANCSSADYKLIHKLPSFGHVWDRPGGSYRRGNKFLLFASTVICHVSSADLGNV